MISDTLSGASHEIKKYLADDPVVYADLRSEIDSVVEQMDSLRIKLDTPPVDTDKNDLR